MDDGGMERAGARVDSRTLTSPKRDSCVAQLALSVKEKKTPSGELL